ncbi:MAG: hypothetical protein WD734_00825, partial [Dehalococcoidia bacterium]
MASGIAARQSHFGDFLWSRSHPRVYPGPGDLGRRIAASPWTLGLPRGLGDTRVAGFGVLGGLSSPASTSWAERFSTRAPSPPTPAPRPPSPDPPRTQRT